MIRSPARVSTHRACIFILLSLVWAGQAWAAPRKTSAEQPGAVVAIGDVHGDFDDFAAILQHIGLIDAQHHWTANKTTLVQAGDLLDRGPKPREVMDLMMALEKEAPKAGGRVVSLLGNHEMMNLMGDLRYVTTENYASFADNKSEERRKSAYQQYTKWRNSHGALLAELPQPMELTEAEWMARHPFGFIEHREAFSPDGSYGKWLREHSALAKIGGVIFLHGGIHPSLAHLKLETINAHIRDEIKAFDSSKQYLQEEKVILPFFTLQEITNVVQAEIIAERKSRVPSDEQKQARLVQFLGYGDWLSVRPDGPLWFRGYDQWSDEEGAAQVGKLLEAYNAAHIAVGHTVQKSGRIRPRFESKVFLIDTGMLSSYYPGGRASAMEICGDAKFTAEYMDQQVVLLDSAVSRPVLGHLQGLRMPPRLRKNLLSYRPAVVSVRQARPLRSRSVLRKRVLRMKRWIERALNVHPGDLGRGTLLCSSLFLVITAYKIGGVAAAALFLSRFQARQLAYADISSSVLVAVVVAGYVLIARRVHLRNLLLGSMLFFASNCALFWVLAHYYSRLVWLFPAFYIWVKLFGVLAPTQIWTLANYVLTTREAKRVFGMVGGGGVAGWIFSGYFSKTVTKIFGTESLLVGMALFISICAGLVVLIWRSGQAAVGGGHEIEEGTAETGPRNLHQSMRLVFSSPYLRAIAAVICVSSLVTTLTGWQFLAIAQQTLVRKDLLAIFLGNFNFYAGILSLLFQLLLTTRFLRRFGIGTALFMLPATVFLGSAGLLAFGTLSAAFVLKGCDQTLRYSLDKSTAELLYLPLAARLKIQVKWFIDTVVWRLGDGLSGLAVLIFATTLHLPARQISWIVLVLVGIWLVSVSVVRKQYVATLKESISQHRVDVEQSYTSVLDRSTAELLATSLSASDPKEILYALSLFEVERQRAAHPVIRSLLSHPSAEVRQKAITILSESGDKTVRADIEPLLRDPDLNVRTEALLYLTHHAHVDPLELMQDEGDFADFSVSSAVVAFLARPGETQILEAAQQILTSMVGEPVPERQRHRVEAARLLGELPDSFDPLLSNLLVDPDPVIAREAIHSVGKLRKRRLVPDLLDRLAHHELRAEAAKALGEFGDTMVGALRDHLGDPSVAVEARREIPSIMVKIGTPAAANVLMENLLESDTTLRFRIISALNKLRRLHPGIKTDTQMVETVLAAEILGHYRSYQILDKLGAAESGEDPIARALTESMQQELERIFRLLGLLYPHLDVHSAYLGLQSKNVSVYDNALEFLDNVLKPQLREMLVPLLDGKIKVSERARLAQRLVHTKIENQEEAVAALVTSNDPWLRSCGAYAIGTFGMKSLEGELNRCLNDPDPLLRETARAAKLRLEAQVTKA